VDACDDDDDDDSDIAAARARKKKQNKEKKDEINEPLKKNHIIFRQRIKNKNGLQ